MPIQITNTALSWLSLFPFILAASADGNSLSPDFTDWCHRRDQLADAERHTVTVLLEEAGTLDCGAAHQYLQTLTTLNLSDRQLTSIAPLASLTWIQTLYLDQNQVADLRPLANLTNLEFLDLYQNQVQDLSPLQSLQRLDVLYAAHNQIQTVDPIAQLPLTELYLPHNQIADASPLQSLTQLTQLDVSHNQLTTVAPLASLIRLVALDIGNNPIDDIEALSSLQRLEKLGLFEVLLSQKTCPVSPATICSFTNDAAEQYQEGLNQLNSGALDEARTAFEAALQIYVDTGDRLRESDTLDRIGNTYAEGGQYANALDYYQQSQAVRQIIGDPQGNIDSLAYLGETYIRLGQPERAIALLNQAWKEYQALGGAIELRGIDREGQVQEGLIYRALALAYSRTDDTTQALRFAKLSLADYRRNNDLGEAQALIQVGGAYLAQGNLDKARLYLSKALRVSQAEDDPAGEARSRYGLGQLAAQQNNPEAALAQYDQALALWRSLKTTGTQDGTIQEKVTETYAVGEAETLNAKGELLLGQGQLEAATTVLEQAATAWEQQRPGLTDADKISIIETQSHTYQLWQQALATSGEKEKALEVSERGRSRAFVELLAHRLALRGEPLPPQQVQPPDIATIKAIAKAQEAILVEYSLVGNELYIWVVEPTGEIHFHQRPVIELLGEMVRQRRRDLGIPGVLLRSADITVIGANRQPSPDILRPLYQLLIEPIAEVLHGEGGANHNTPIVIIPHGELFLVPFAALPTPDGKMLIDKHPLLFSPAISVLKAAPERSPLRLGHDDALVVGNPQMPNQPGSGLPWPPLAGAKREAIAVSELLGAESLTGSAATKAAVVSRMAAASIVHLATHGLLDDMGTGVPGALAFTPTAGDSGYLDDGYLTAAEISELPMSARLVVLSACDTGQGRITGDGVVGLSRSFLTAGVESVVVTLWAIPDGETVELMTEFYRQLQRQPNRAVALQKAMIATRDRYADGDPTRWAAFTLFGAAE